MGAMCDTTWNRLMRFYSDDVMNQLKIFYGSFLPVGVRMQCSDFIETALFNMLSKAWDSNNYELMTQQFKNDLVHEISEKYKSMSAEGEKILVKEEFRDALRRFPMLNSIELFEKFTEIFKREMTLLHDLESGNYLSYAKGTREIDHRVELLKERTSLFQAKDFSKWKKAFSNYQEESTNIVQMNCTSPVETIEYSLHVSSLELTMKSLKNLQPEMIDSLQKIINNYSEIARVVIEDYVVQWKRSQQKYGSNEFNINGADLDKIGVWCSDIGKILFIARDSIKILEENQNFLSLSVDNDNFTHQLLNLKQQANELLLNLTRDSIVIENMPPQVIKTNTRFNANIRLLIGNAVDNKINNASVVASIVSECQAKSFYRSDSEATCGDLLNNTVTIEFSDGSKQLVGNLRNMLLKNFKRMGKKSHEMVTEEKFAMIFKVKATVGDMNVEKRVMSLPIIIIVHGSQEINALATIFWDNAFADFDRQPFQVADTVNWSKFAEALSNKFFSSTGRGLTPENLHFLATKIYKESVPFPVPNDYFVTYSDFCKNRLDGRDFSFWDWFHSILKLIKDHLKTAWFEGRIEGFIDKKKTEELLLNCAHGTFMLRFSDSAMGAVSIAWTNNEAYNREVLHLQPINSKEFEIILLANRINDVEHLQYLYPDIPKHQAFKIDSDPFIPGDYVRFMTTMRIALGK